MTGGRQAADDADRLAHWVREHGRAVHGYLFSLTRDRHAADDLLQDVFCRAWEARRRYVDNGRERAYLLRIADRLACDRVRRAHNTRGRREKLLDADRWKIIEPIANGQPHDELLAGERQTQLNRALETLSEPQRRTLLLRYFGDLEFSDIARILDCPLNTALSHGRRGLQALRRLLVEEPLAGESPTDATVEDVKK
jgi:RNA polymerase sigma-70 factor, ECF subfamily